MLINGTKYSGETYPQKGAGPQTDHCPPGGAGRALHRPGNFPAGFQRGGLCHADAHPHHSGNHQQLPYHFARLPVYPEDHLRRVLHCDPGGNSAGRSVFSV